MFTIKADALSAILDKVTPHHLRARADDDVDMVVLDCASGRLHAVAVSANTLAVARTPVDSTAR
ncbi:hypothetical protein ACWDBP_34840 [Streptomyces sp. NPDC001233]|uniref:hypothetical protein n=1 Tax=Streptomyces sp. NPDC002589 TaxID=3154420 RepID=UPI0033336E92